ncbi:unnamed protein product [Zymoseptoria tritici ST99CH_3D1]|nr:unnamed protein product [Zymoseptoria tritici ST99CH_3D1]
MVRERVAPSSAQRKISQTLYQKPSESARKQRASEDSVAADYAKAMCEAQLLRETQQMSDQELCSAQLLRELEESLK